MNLVTLNSNDNNSTVKIVAGELVSYIVHGEEIMHQKGNPGWRNTDTEMFPIIGPTAEADFTVSTPKGNCIQDQHGVLRELKYTLIYSNSTSAVYQKAYIANTKIKNSKYPEKSTEETVFWPYSFNFKKTVELTNTSLKIIFEIEAEKGMPFMLGYHPAFMLNGNLDEFIKVENKEITIPIIMKGGDTAFPILNTNEIKLMKTTGLNINIQTAGFYNFMLWTPVSTMLCIEPITAYPYTEGEFLSEKLFMKSSGMDIFEVLITPQITPVPK